MRCRFLQNLNPAPPPPAPLDGPVIYHDVFDLVIRGKTIRASGTRGLEIKRCGKVVIEDCRIEIVGDSPKQTDGIYCQDNDEVIIRRTTIVMGNGDDTSHSDCFQSFRDGSVILADNHFENAPSGGHNHVVWIANCGAVGATGNNFYSMNDAFNFTVWRDADNAPVTESITLVRNNLFGGVRGFNFERVPEPEMEDNHFEGVVTEVYRSKML